MKLIITALLLLFTSNVFAATKGALENPSQGSYTSGIYMFSGWACEADLIEIVINGGSGLKAAYGTDRGDTQGICGDSDNGFGLLFNMSNLGTGEHTAVAFADGLEIGRSTFSVQRLSTGEFLRGEQALSIDSNFPRYGRESWLTWVESAQNYAIAFEQDAVDPYEVSGVWVNEAGEYFSLSTNRLEVDRAELYAVGTTAFGSESTTIGYHGYIIGTAAYLISAVPSGFTQEFLISFHDSLNATINVPNCQSGAGIICGAKRTQIRKLLGPNTAVAPVKGDIDSRPIDSFLSSQVSKP